MSDKAIFNVAGIPSFDFIQEVKDSQTRKVNELVFALTVQGLAGQPDYGINLSQSIGDSLNSDTKFDIITRLRLKIPELTENIGFDGAVVDVIPKTQLVGVDLACTDLETNQSFILPAAVKGRQL